MSTIRFQQVQVEAGVIDLGVGQPQNSILPLDHMRRAAALQFSRASAEYLQYGSEWGDGHLRVALADHLGRAYGTPVDAEHLFVSNGNSQALDQICTVLTEPGDVVLVEDPTYFLALDIFRDHGLELVSIPMTDDGIDAEALERALVHGARTGRPPRLLYTIPAFHNPTGITASETCRDRVVELAGRHGCLVVADEVYQLLPAAGAAAPPSPYSSRTASGHVVSIGTFSKILAPGLRLGWVHGRPDVLAALADSGLVVSGGGLNPVPSMLATAMLTEGWQDEYVGYLRSLFAARIEVMDAALHEHAPAARWRRPDGGYYFWLRLPDELDGASLREECRRVGVDLRHGRLFSPSGGCAGNVRLSFAYYGDDEIVEGVRRFGRALRTLAAR